ncbi:chemotaxis protein CheB [Fodinibius roseus]|nr:chemotaxis protein CheB [Fodinibius roseus]
MESKRNESTDELLTVGLGASAGGLEALKQFFQSLPGETGIAFIVVMHLSPDRESNIADLLQAHTSLHVSEVNRHEKIKPDHVYVISPDKILTVEEGYLELSEPDRERKGHATVDLLFRSLAGSKGKKSAGIILSGSGSDGAVGIKKIREQGGLTIAQKPGEASFSAMPQSAIDTGVVDLVLPVKEIPEKLLAYKESLSRTDFLRKEERKDGLQVIYKKLRSAIGHDFSYYKQATLLRRIERRMHLTNCFTFEEYVDYLDEQPKEIENLFGDLLISVTRFFRDAEVFENLKENVIPGLFEEKGPEDQVRVWVPGCATGEEAYSIAILLQEYVRQSEHAPEIRIFASDINRDALMYGRGGVYPESIEVDVPDSLLDRYFVKTEHKYQLRPVITDMVLFAHQDLLTDPPFSNLDLLACRNLLIYLKREIQTEVFNLFNYVLRPGGVLFLGQSDSDLKAAGLFDVVDKKHRIYRKPVSPDSQANVPKLPLKYQKNRHRVQRSRSKFPQKKKSIKEFHQNLLMRLYAPQSVIVNDVYEVIHATEGIQKYLEYGGGEPSANILDMIIPELREVVRALLYELEHGNNATKRKTTAFGPEEERRSIEIIVHRFDSSEFPDRFIHVVFKELKPAEDLNTDSDVVDSPEIAEEEVEVIERLEKELRDNRERLHRTVEEYETANEELRSSNEELQSMNEELHSATEELETSQNELKSVNRELESKVEKLRQANNDLKNLMKVAEVVILFVDDEFRVQRFTESAFDVFNLIPSDTGRPIKHVTHQLNYNKLGEDLEYVYNTREEIEKLVTSVNNHTYMMRLCPYRSVENKVEGVALSFMDVTKLKEAEEKLQQQKLQESLARMGTYALGVDDLESIIDRALQQICLALDADYALLLTWHPDENTLKLTQATGYEPGEEGITEMEADPKWDAGYAFQKESPTVISDYQNEQRVRLIPLLAHLDIQSGLAVRVTESDEVCGVLGIYFKNKRTFSRDELNFVQIASNIIGMSSERSKNKQSLEEANKRLKEEVQRCNEYQKEILQTNIAERWNLGGYLHDNLAQTLASIKITASRIGAEIADSDLNLSAEIDSILENIDEGIGSIRNLTHEIIPIDIEEGGVKRALRLLVRQLRKTHGVSCSLETGDIIESINDKKVATNLYHIIQEAVKNAAIHGEADNVEIKVLREKDQLKLQITDDGIGLSKAKSDGDGGSGTNIMRHRIEIIGGSFNREEIAEADHSGTRVLCKLPLECLNETDNER